MPIDSKNVVNEVFWTNFAGEQIYDSFNARIKAVDKLQTFINWVFGLFTTSGLVFVFFGKGDIQHCALSCWGIGFALLLLGAFFALESGFPIKKKMDPNLAASVSKAFSSAIRSSGWYFRIAAYAVMTGVFMIAIGFIVQFWAGKPSAEGKWQIHGYLQKIPGGYAVPFTVHGAKNHPFEMMIHRMNDAKAGVSIFNARDNLLVDQIDTSDADGNYTGVYSVPDSSCIRLTVSAPGEAGRFEVTAVKVPFGKP
jgi:hypothetical protein